jgi:hypothetical protein
VVRRGGEADAPIIVRSAPGERARLTGTVMITRGAAHVHLTHADIVGAAGQNTVKVYGRDIVLEHLDITNEHRGGSCVILGSGRGGRTVRPIVRRSFLHACGAPADGNKDHGIYAGRAVDAEIVDNLLVDPAAYAIQLYPDAQRAHVEHNVIVGGPDSIRGGIVIGGDDTATANGNVVERNVIAGTATAAVDAYWEDAVGEGNVIRANCIWEGSGDFTAEGIELRDNLVADPRFRDPEAGDYRLHPAGPCVDRVGFLGHPSTLAR